jgi:hypothetical protein
MAADITRVSMSSATPPTVTRRSSGHACASAQKLLSVSREHNRTDSDRRARGLHSTAGGVPSSASTAASRPPALGLLSCVFRVGVAELLTRPPNSTPDMSVLGATSSASRSGLAAGLVAGLAVGLPNGLGGSLGRLGRWPFAAATLSPHARADAAARDASNPGGASASQAGGYAVWSSANRPFARWCQLCRRQELPCR